MRIMEWFGVKIQDFCFDIMLNYHLSKNVSWYQINNEFNRLI